MSDALGPQFKLDLTPPTTAPDEYQCALCGGIFMKIVSETEAIAEAEKRFPGLIESGVETDVVCDDCWNKMHPDENPEMAAYVNELIQAALAEKKGK